MCSVLEVSREVGSISGLRMQNMQQRDRLTTPFLVSALKRYLNAHKRRYGAVRIRNELKKENTKVSIKRVNRLMKSRNLVSLHKRPFKVVTTNS
jgi:hypothetical protein